MMSDAETIKKLKKEALLEIEKIRDVKSLERFHIAYLGRKGRVPMFLRGVAELPMAKRKEAGIAGNALRKELEEKIAMLQKKLSGKTDAVGGKVVKESTLDVSRPGKRISRGHIHVLSQTLSDIRHIFLRMGFSAVEGPEVESEWYNFDALNIPKDHPAREMQDTFWLKAPKNADITQNNAEGSLRPSVSGPRESALMLRTHISGIQVRHMETHQPPFRIYYEGRAFRHDATDATHDYQFHQFETLYVDRQLSVGNFKYIIEQFLREFFKKDVQIRLRPAYFPFVEPGFEIDMTCVRCGGKKCTLCTTGWVEICGAGMVHQNVFRAAGYVPGQWTGIAFAFGVERLAMLKYRIPDIRLFFGGDLRFIEQF